MRLIHTKSQSQYIIDEENKTFKRSKGTWADPAHGDGQEVKYEQILRMEIGFPLEIVWELDGETKIRQTSPIIKIENWS